MAFRSCTDVRNAARGRRAGGDVLADSSVGSIVVVVDDLDVVAIGVEQEAAV
jgi:hypothetical protein